MANRLSRIVTRSGDKGSTSLADGSRVSKDSLRIQAIGDVDELNSTIGVLLCESLPEEIQKEILAIQHDLFDIGGELSIPEHASVTSQQVTRIELVLEKYNSSLPPLREFILPGGSRAGALFHLCRSVCRRAERTIVSLSRHETLSEPMLQYVNRLSDLLFVLARAQNGLDGQQDVLWNSKRNVQS